MTATNSHQEAASASYPLNCFYSSEGLWQKPGKSLQHAPIPHYGFLAGEVGLLIPTGISSEVMPLPPLYLLPNTAPWLRGLINLRGDLAPVFDLHGLFFPEEQARPNSLLLILGKGEASVGMLIDDLPRPLHDLSPLARQPPFPGALSGYVHNPCRQGDTVYWEFRYQEFLRSLTPKIPI